MAINRRAQVRKVKRDLTKTLSKLFAGKKPTVEKALEALENVLKFYPLPATIGVRLNRVTSSDPPTIMLDIFNPAQEKLRETMKQLESS